jgi:signal transduction histidine kinase
MPATTLVDRLAAHRTLGTAPRAQLEWLAAHGEVRVFEPGQVVTPRTGPVLGLYVVLTGHLSIHVDRGAGRKKVMEWHAGDVTGLLPYSRLTAPPGDVVAEEPSELLLVMRDHMNGMIRECHELTAITVHVMLDRARQFTTSDLHDEKMLSLGKLSAGLAHELNNPASAAARGADALMSALAVADAAARELGAAGLSPAQLAQVEAIREASGRLADHARTPIERADREDAFGGWLTGHGLDDGHAETFSESAIELTALDDLAAALDGPVLSVAIDYLAAVHFVRRLASEIETAVDRVHTLVAAMKRFSYMDRAQASTPVKVGEGLADTLTMLNAKAKAKSVSLVLNAAPDLPLVSAIGGELNQIWTNLVDNAVDAAPPGGHVEISAARAGRMMVVRVVDDGPGIPAAVLGRIFDPFFTTKPVGHGTGLGLDIVRRLVRRHRGEIDVDSRPGRTEFRVSLPVVETS